MFGLADKRRSDTRCSTGIQRFGLPLACAGLVAVVGGWSYTAIERSIKRSLANELTTILHADVTALQLWVDEQEHTVDVRASEARVRKLVGELVDLAARETTTPAVLLHSTALRALREYLEPMCRTHGYIGFVVTDRRGVNVGALLDEPVGQRSLANRSDFVERALAGETLVCRPFPGEVLLPDEQGVFRAGRPTMFAAAPVRGQGGQIIAALSFRIRPEVDFTRILSVARLGETGETYAFDNEGLLLSTSRFDAQLKDIGLLPDRAGVQSNLRIQIRDPGGNMLDGFRPAPEQELPLTRMAAEAVTGHAGVDVDGYRDYRGVPVVGAWIWLAEYGFGVATEIDRAEAYGPLTQARRAFAVIIGLLLLTAGVGMLLGRKNRKTVAALRDSEARNLAIMESAADGIITIDQSGIVQAFNAAASRIFGYSAEEVLGRNIKMLMPSPDAQEHDRHVHDYLRTGLAKMVGIRREVVGRRKDGSTFPMDLHVAELWLGERRVFTGIIRDITEQERTRERLRENAAVMVDALEREKRSAVQLEATMSQLAAARDRAETASRAKTEFLANMSHEIRTPMTAILGFTETMLDPSQSDSEKLDAAHTVRRNGQHLLQIINDILDISKIEAGKLEIERIRCSPVQILSEVKSLMRVRADAKNLRLLTEYIGDIPETIETDPTRLKQILVNLVGNAIKFTEVGGVRLITRFVEHSAQPRMQFDVIDTGLGMTPKQLSKLFQAFSQADSSTTRKFGGTGLGLMISKRLAEMLGGDITVESKLDEWSQFRITVSTGPLAGVKMLDDPATAEIAQPEETTLAKADVASLDCRILLAEDGPDNQRLISFLLKKAGAKVTIVENGKLAADAAFAARDEGDPFQVILMDMQMPVMDGYEATRRLRQGGYIGPIIALTAHAMAGDQQKCVDAGCDEYVAKPIDRERLINVIQATLNETRDSTNDHNDLIAVATSSEPDPSD